MFENIFILEITALQVFQREDLYKWLPIILVSVLVLATIFAFIKLSPFLKGFSFGMSALVGLITGKGTGNNSIDTTIKTAGYSYDPKQDMFYSTMNAWQRNHGYCRLYDEAAALMGMIIDCEPIYFEYENKKWLIEFWKGQYDLTTGGEIGIYTDEIMDRSIVDAVKGDFYNSASNEDRLEMAFSLKKKGRTLFTRQGKHWWLTGFRLGEFSEPSELTMNLNITFKNEFMRDAFINGLKQAGYQEHEIFVYRNTVGLIFDKPRTTQPVTRIPETDKIIQRKNKLMCDKFKDITKAYSNMSDKLMVVQKQSPELYNQAVNIGKTKQLLGKYEKPNRN